MSSWLTRFALLLLATGLTGCAVDRPNWLNPGTVPEQQRRAGLHDPYADVDAGPEVVGGRPREFQKPRPEPVRADPSYSRRLRFDWWSYPRQSA